MHLVPKWRAMALLEKNADVSSSCINDQIGDVSSTNLLQEPVNYSCQSSRLWATPSGNNAYKWGYMICLCRVRGNYTIVVIINLFLRTILWDEWRWTWSSSQRWQNLVIAIIALMSKRKNLNWWAEKGQETFPWGDERKVVVDFFLSPTD